MKSKELNERIKNLELLKNKYNYLTLMNDDQINSLKEKLNEYTKTNTLNFSINLIIPDELTELYELLKQHNINYRQIEDYNTYQEIFKIIDNSINYLKENLRLLDLNINSLYTFDYVQMKNDLNIGKILDEKDLLKLRNDDNKEFINDLIKKTIQYKKGGLVNKEQLKKELLKEEKLFIDSLDEMLNSYCFITNIDYEGLSFIEKYIKLKETINNRINSYSKISNILKTNYKIVSNIENDFTKAMKNSGFELHLSYFDLKELSEKNIEEIRQTLILYNDALKGVTKENIQVIKS